MLRTIQDQLILQSEFLLDDFGSLLVARRAADLRKLALWKAGRLATSSDAADSGWLAKHREMLAKIWVDRCQR